MPRSPPKKPFIQDKPTPQNYRIFDPWNSSSSGHQHAENPFAGTTTWRETRTAKLKRQFRGEDEARDTAGALDDGDFSAGAFDGRCGSVSPVAEGYRDGDGGGVGSISASARTRAGEWRWVSGEEATRARLGVRDIRCFMGVGKRKAGGESQSQSQGQGVKRVRIEKGEMRAIPATTTTAPVSASASKSSTTTTMTPSTTKTTDKPPTSKPKAEPEPEPEHPRKKHITTPPNNTPPPKIFTGTTIYINGSTLPQISDHKLKSLLSAHGATIAIAMARRTVSHVIIGQPGTAGQGCGGGLAAGKLQGEIERGGWKGVKVVGVDW